jgi:manganese-transporting P-type ATPase
MLIIFQSEDGEPKLWFIFQKLKYVFNWDRKTFELIHFPVDGWASEYLKSDGIQSIDDENRTKEDFGLNKLDMVFLQYHTGIDCVLMLLLYL